MNADVGSDQPAWLRPLVQRVANLEQAAVQTLRIELGILRSRSEVIDALLEREVPLDGPAVAAVIDGLVLSHLYGFDARELVDLAASDESSDHLESSLASLLASPVVRLLAKATDLSAASERRFETARVFTDVRPLFLDADRQGATGADDSVLTGNVVVMNTLRVEFVCDDGPASFWVGMTRGDLVELRNTVERAIMKSNRILSALPDGATDLTGE